jgi:hypothetical protein
MDDQTTDGARRDEHHVEDDNVDADEIVYRNPVYSISTTAYTYGRADSNINTSNGMDTCTWEFPEPDLVVLDEVDLLTATNTGSSRSISDGTCSVKGIGVGTCASANADLGADVAVDMSGGGTSFSSRSQLTWGLDDDATNGCGTDGYMVVSGYTRE